MHDKHEYHRRVREHVGRFFRCVEFDKRGIGLPDRLIGDLPTQLQDITTVMDALGWQTAHLWGISEGGMMAQLFAAEHPERVLTPTLVDTFVSPRYYGRFGAHHRRSVDPVPLGKDGIATKFDEISRTCGTDANAQVEWEVPSKAGGAPFVRWMARVQRSAATDLLRRLDSVTGLDAGDTPEWITVPTLVRHVPGDRVLTVAMGRLLAELIPDVLYQEIDGDDHFCWILPNWRDMADRFIGFATGQRPGRSTTCSFGTVLFTDIVGSTRRAAELATAGAGLHVGEIELHEDGDVSGIAVNPAARVEQAAGDRQVWVSSTVRDMMIGFVDAGEHALEGFDGGWRLYSVGGPN